MTRDGLCSTMTHPGPKIFAAKVVCLRVLGRVQEATEKEEVGGARLAPGMHDGQVRSDTVEHANTRLHSPVSKKHTVTLHLAEKKTWKHHSHHHHCRNHHHSPPSHRRCRSHDCYSRQWRT